MAPVLLVILLIVLESNVSQANYDKNLATNDPSLSSLQHQKSKEADKEDCIMDRKTPTSDNIFFPSSTVLQNAAKENITLPGIRHKPLSTLNCSSRYRRSEENYDLFRSVDDLEQGFNAMRGRRDQGFNAMRGRRGEGLNEIRERRLQGFSAMRGRREDEVFAMRNRRMQQGFSAMRGRRNPYSVFTNERALVANGILGDRDIRNVGFNPIRGKRISSELEDTELLNSRSTRLQGFNAMRGKRIYSESSADVTDERSNRQVGFNAMRGKRILLRDSEDDLPNKRSVRQAGFSPMRGKRGPITSDRYIIIRGKREEGSDNRDGQFLEHPTSLEKDIKRAAFNPSAVSFNAMRGKKSNFEKA